MSESITGYIDHIIFRNEDNGYTVMVLKGVSEEDELTCVGSFPVVTQGASVELEGNFTQRKTVSDILLCGKNAGRCTGYGKIPRFGCD